MESFALSSLSTSFSLPTRSSFLHHRFHHHPISKSSPSISTPHSIPTLRSSSSSSSSLFFPIKPTPNSSLFKPRFLPPIHSSSTKSPNHPSPSPQITQSAKPIPLILSISIGLIVRFLIPKPPEVTPQAWQLLSIFVSTIAGLVLKTGLGNRIATYFVKWLGRSTLGLSYGLTISEALIAPATHLPKSSVLILFSLNFSLLVTLVLFS